MIKAAMSTHDEPILTALMQASDLEDLRIAKQLLENPGLAAKLTNLLGKPLEAGFELLPETIHTNLAKVTRSALTTAMSTALFTLKDIQGAAKSNKLHKLAVAASGGAAGLFGLAALAVELPISTTIMLRSIADVARSEGESIQQIESTLACIEVFALGSPSSSDDDAVESGYFAVRASLAQSVNAASKHIAKEGLGKTGAPALVRLINAIASKFSIQVSEKVAAQAIPLVGAAGGALINTLFIDHFQNMAHGHFIVRRLERKYGKEMVKATYQTLKEPIV